MTSTMIIDNHNQKDDGEVPESLSTPKAFTHTLVGKLASITTDTKPCVVHSLIVDHRPPTEHPKVTATYIIWAQHHHGKPKSICNKYPQWCWKPIVFTHALELEALETKQQIHQNNQHPSGLRKHYSRETKKSPEWLLNAIVFTHTLVLKMITTLIK